MTTCSCKLCADLCRENPGWPTPEEAEKAITAGYASRYMRDWLEPDIRFGNSERVYVIAPASKGCEGGDAPEFSFESFLSCGVMKKGQCVFLKKGLCELHESGFKPKQCREASGCTDAVCSDNYQMARLWDTEHGRRVVYLWTAATSVTA